MFDPIFKCFASRLFFDVFSFKVKDDLIIDTLQQILYGRCWCEFHFGMRVLRTNSKCVPSLIN